MQFRTHRTATAFLTLCRLLSGLVLLPALGLAQATDPLPSWNEGVAKTAIIEFVKGCGARGRPDAMQPSPRLDHLLSPGGLFVFRKNHDFLLISGAFRLANVGLSLNVPLCFPVSFSTSSDCESCCLAAHTANAHAPATRSNELARARMDESAVIIGYSPSSLGRRWAFDHRTHGRTWT